MFPDFMSLRDFLLLCDPNDREPKRALHGDTYLARTRDRSPATRQCKAYDLVTRYDIAKASWDEYGPDGPPVGASVEMLYGGHGGNAGVTRRFDGVWSGDPRYFQVSRDDSVSLVNRETWFAEMRVVTQPEENT